MGLSSAEEIYDNDGQDKTNKSKQNGPCDFVLFRFEVFVVVVFVVRHGLFFRAKIIVVAEQFSELSDFPVTQTCSQVPFEYPFGYQGLVLWTGNQLI